MPDRDFLAAVRERVVVFDGGMGATLEQFDLSLEKDYQLPGRAHEALVLNRPDVIEGVHASMVAAGAEVVETDTFQGSRIKLDEWAWATTPWRSTAARPRSPARRSASSGSSPARSGHRPPPRLDDPTLGKITFRELVATFAEQAQGLLEGGVDLVIIETARTSSRSRRRSSGSARRSRSPAAGCRSRPRSRCCPTAARCCWAPTSTRC